jgi:hypothetical protein
MAHVAVGAHGVSQPLAEDGDGATADDRTMPLEVDRNELAE